MSTLEAKRHTLAHLLAAAVHEKYPHAKPTIGPAIDNGFYYDFDFSGGTKPNEEDLAVFEKSMRSLLPTWSEMHGVEVNEEEAGQRFAGNQFKLELIKEIAEKGEEITLYTAGNFTDLCRGGHAENPAKDIKQGSFLLDRIAGAYWRGDEKNPMLTRIYGLAYDTKEELAAYLAQREEAKKRDHRKIAKEQGLLVFSDLVGSGMPMFTPKGNIIRSAIINYSRELNAELGFGEVHTPNINKGELFKISGHYDKYKEDMLSVHSQYVEDEMFLKRDLPVRFSDFAVLYRDERPGELSGLTRLRAFSQDDGHIFCREDQIESELTSVLGAIKKALATYRIDYWVRLSLRDPAKKEKYIGEDAVWEKSEAIMRTLLTSENISHKEALGEAAFYGPKMDIMAIDAIGREWQISTIQLDLNMPGRFNLEYTAEDGTRKTPVMIHRALIGSPDRFMGVLIEHYAGAFPLWLSPVQARVLSVSEKHADYAKEVVSALKAANIRADLDDANESLGKKIRNAKGEKIPYLLVVGDAEVETKTVSIDSRDAGKLDAMPIADFITKAVDEITRRG
ncbi:MAG: threonine--tRNA ligase [Candidatus Kaiserbacteria bacterium]|nr:threonine--tRNA ligase [Candidatus Kaiserbacteria bacterium]